MSVAASDGTRFQLEVTKPTAATPLALFWVRFTPSRNGFCRARKAAGTLRHHSSLMV